MDTALEKLNGAIDNILTKGIKETAKKAWDESKMFEREACAELVEEHKGIYLNSQTSTDIVQKIAEAIRNRV